MNNNIEEEDFYKFGPRKAKILAFRRPKGFMSYYYDHMLGNKHTFTVNNIDQIKDQIKKKQNDTGLIDVNMEGCKIEVKHKIEKKKNNLQLIESEKRKKTINRN
ncbi:hypothetical protein NBO_18g0003 [Nosema bombycis CQ1]|uniref:Uncharacterized protein n=1 Tax=Nosema bombycis (strain CQ1 / CVCC 102059) TaxID=578461 RepID=R0KUX2_NOSB1|nr:hypothetical protein NBO_18g0003 [Nosema bombycis CQ1]|eukprot:EOB14676.1 hypothetical protein NBO_18g0003 [Nosema bombycis CQ1]